MTPEPPCRPTKTCTACHETKPLTDFHRHAKSPQGRRSSCKECEFVSADEVKPRGE